MRLGLPVSKEKVRHRYGVLGLLASEEAGEPQVWDWVCQCPRRQVRHKYETGSASVRGGGSTGMWLSVCQCLRRQVEHR